MNNYKPRNKKNMLVSSGLALATLGLTVASSSASAWGVVDPDIWWGGHYDVTQTCRPDVIDENSVEEQPTAGRSFIAAGAALTGGFKVLGEDAGAAFNLYFGTAIDLECADVEASDGSVYQRLQPTEDVLDQFVRGPFTDYCNGLENADELDCDDEAEDAVETAKTLLTAMVPAPISGFDASFARTFFGWSNNPISWSHSYPEDVDYISRPSRPTSHAFNVNSPNTVHPGLFGPLNYVNKIDDQLVIWEPKTIPGTNINYAMSCGYDVEYSSHVRYYNQVQNVANHVQIEFNDLVVGFCAVGAAAQGNETGIAAMTLTVGGVIHTEYEASRVTDMHGNAL